jgi:hypothetical protein
MKIGKLKIHSILIVLIAAFFFSGCGIGRGYRIIKKPDFIKIEEPLKAFNIGERLTYKAEWMGMDVGTAVLSVEDIVERNGREVYCILASVRTSSLISKLYKVEDEIYTYLDVEKFYPVRFEKKQREGKYRSDEYIDFDQEKGKALYFSRLSHEKKEFDIPEKVQDPLSCLYYFRLQEVAVGRSLFTNVNADEDNYLLEGKVHEKGFIKINGNDERHAFKVEPVPWFQGKIKRKAKATIWFSADEKRIPLLMVTSGIPFVGTVTITLQSVENLDTAGQ